MHSIIHLAEAPSVYDAKTLWDLYGVYGLVAVLGGLLGMGAGSILSSLCEGKLRLGGTIYYGICICAGAAILMSIVGPGSSPVGQT